MMENLLIMNKYNDFIEKKDISFPIMTESVALDLFPPDMLLCSFRGSVVHGMYRPSDEPNSIDDVDLMGVCFPPTKALFGRGRFERKESFVGPFDCVTYELRKMVNLLSKGNPNVISILFLRPEFYLYMSDAGKSLIEDRDMFLSMRVYQAFAGYAAGQMHRMENLAFEGYMGEKRKRLVKAHGYDTKNAAHLVRLLRMAKEFLKDGVMNVYRGDDADELLEIKNGKYSLDEVKKMAESLFDECNVLKNKTSLRLEPDEEQIEGMLITWMLNLTRYKYF